MEVFYTAIKKKAQELNLRRSSDNDVFLSDIPFMIDPKFQTNDLCSLLFL